MGYFGFLIGPLLIGTSVEWLGLWVGMMLIVVFCGIIALTALRLSPEADFSGQSWLACYCPMQLIFRVEKVLIVFIELLMELTPQLNQDL